MGQINTFSRYHGICCGHSNPIQAGTISVTPAGVFVHFSTPLNLGTNYQVTINSCKNSSNEDTGYEVYGETLLGFFISTIEDATVKYLVNVY